MEEFPFRSRYPDQFHGVESFLVKFNGGAGAYLVRGDRMHAVWYGLDLGLAHYRSFRLKDPRRLM